MKRTVYVAGPMRGLPAYNFPAFFEAEARFRAWGWTVVNPARMDVEKDGSDPSGGGVVEQGPSVYAQRDLPRITRCDAIALLPGWDRSRGALAELATALWCRLDVLDALTGRPLTVILVANLQEEDAA